MADTATTVREAISTVGNPDPKRRDFLKLVTGSAAAIGAAAIAWPLVDSMNPAKDVLALASIEVDLSPISEGQGLTAVWRGKPVFVRHRTAQEIQEAERPEGSLPDPQPDGARVKAGHEPWIVVVGRGWADGRR